MDEVADALCSARHFVFASPATFLARKFVPPATTFLSSMVEEEENENFDFSASTTTEGLVCPPTNFYLSNDINKLFFCFTALRLTMQLKRMWRNTATNTPLTLP